MTVHVWEILLACYMLGSIPSAYIVARVVKGVDIREVGDGNMGAVNTFRSIGKLPGALVAIADIGKGMASVLLAQHFFSSETLVWAAGACAVVGHDFPVFLRFRGGQGMAAMVGAFFVLFPAQTVAAMSFLAITMLLTHNWDLSVFVGFVLLVGLLILVGHPASRVLYVIAMLPTLGIRKLMQLRHARELEGHCAADDPACERGS